MLTATITRVGNSVGLIIPKEYRVPGFSQGDKVQIEKTDGALIIRPIKEPMTLQSLMRGYDGPKPEFIEPGASIGKEIW